MSWQPGVYYVGLRREFNLEKNYAQAEEKSIKTTQLSGKR